MDSSRLKWGGIVSRDGRVKAQISSDMICASFSKLVDIGHFSLTRKGPILPFLVIPVLNRPRATEAAE